MYVGIRCITLVMALSEKVTTPDKPTFVSYSMVWVVYFARRNPTVRTQEA